MTTMTDQQILKDLKTRFKLLGDLTQGLIDRTTRACIVSGAPGVGKTYAIERVLEENRKPFEIVKGTISPINLYMLAYRNRHPSNIIVLDDADSIFLNEDALNIFKVLCDTSEVREVSYMKEANALKENSIPSTFVFNGGLMFVSNLDFQKYVDENNSKLASHFEALMSRSMYLDLRLHSRRAVLTWIAYLATMEDGIFSQNNILGWAAQDTIEYLTDNLERLREISIRTLLKLINIMKTSGENWKETADILLLKN